MSVTHEVFNQVPSLIGRGISTFPALWEGLHREGAGWAEHEVRDLSLLANGAEAQDWSVLANVRTPVLHTHDQWGFRIDEVEYDHAYHRLVHSALSHGLGGSVWNTQ